MVASVSAVLNRFTPEWATQVQPEAIIGAWAEAGSTSWRDRVLPPVTTLQLLLFQMLHGHTACRHLPHLSGLRFSAAASCQARARLPRRLFDRLLERFSRALQPGLAHEGRWHGQRTVLVDGSGGSMPDSPALQATCGQPTVQRPGGGVPGARLRGRFPASTGLLLKLVVAPLLTPDLAQVRAVQPS